jgi:hypothetical protein
MSSCPDKNEFVHHALTYRMTADQREGVDQRDADDPGTGYECFGGVGAGPGGLSPSGRGRGSELVAGWAPGAKPGIYPDGAGLKMQPGDFFVTQGPLPLRPRRTPRPEPVDPAVGFRAHRELRRRGGQPIPGPSRDPLHADEKGPLCDRAASIQALTDEFGPAAPVIANGLNAVCGSTPEETANVDAEGISTSSCEHGVSSVGKLLSVNGHMHELGRTFRMTLNPTPRGEGPPRHRPLGLQLAVQLRACRGHRVDQ